MFRLELRVSVPCGQKGSPEPLHLNVGYAKKDLNKAVLLVPQKDHKNDDF